MVECTGATPLSRAGQRWLGKCACLGVKNIGKPCAGKLHARFDEGGQARVCPLLYLRFPLLTPQDEYRRQGKTDEERREAYRSLFRAHVDEALVDEIRSATNGNFALGGKRFQSQIARALGRRVSRGVAGRPRKEEGDGDRQQTLL